MLSSEAVSIGLFDVIMGSNVEEFQNELEHVATQVGLKMKIKLFSLFVH